MKHIRVETINHLAAACPVSHLHGDPTQGWSQVIQLSVTLKAFGFSKLSQAVLFDEDWRKQLSVVRSMEDLHLQEFDASSPMEPWNLV